MAAAMRSAVEAGWAARQAGRIPAPAARGGVDAARGSAGPLLGAAAGRRPVDALADRAEHPAHAMGDAVEQRVIERGGSPLGVGAEFDRRLPDRPNSASSRLAHSSQKPARSRSCRERASSASCRSSVVMCSMSSTAKRITMPVSPPRSAKAARTSAIRAPTPCAAGPPCSPYAAVRGPNDSSSRSVSSTPRNRLSPTGVPSKAGARRPQRQSAGARTRTARDRRGARRGGVSSCRRSWPWSVTDRGRLTKGFAPPLNRRRRAIGMRTYVRCAGTHRE